MTYTQKHPIATCRSIFYHMELPKLRLIFKFIITVVLATFVSEYGANPDLTVAVIGLMWTDVIKDISEAWVKVKNE